MSGIYLGQFCARAPSFQQKERIPSSLTRLVSAAAVTLNTLILKPVNFLIDKTIVPVLLGTQSFLAHKTWEEASIALNHGKVCAAAEVGAKVLNPKAPVIESIWDGAFKSSFSNLTSYLATKAKQLASSSSKTLLEKVGIEENLAQSFSETLFNIRTFSSNYLDVTAQIECSHYSAHLNYMAGYLSTAFYVAVTIAILKALTTYTSSLGKKIESPSSAPSPSLQALQNQVDVLQTKIESNSIEDAEENIEEEPALSEEEMKDLDTLLENELKPSVGA